jgi:transcriptional regulator with XRE-family HTH domain
MDHPVITCPSEIETLARSVGRSMADVCRIAGVAQSTFSRWKKGTTSPTLEVCRRLTQAVRNPGDNT